MSMRSLSLGFFFEAHTYAHTLPAVWKSLQKSARPYSAVVFNILAASELWNKPPLTHTHTRYKFESLSLETLTKLLYHFLYAVFQQKNLPVIQFIQTLNALK